ncbi:ubiquitin-activating E1 FCCH domain-containing protein [Burkholderia vietnamiensis]|uniref:ubiquitin-activating E1 FCCH domain-containing protein n=1 Tax=Burkholderia vietnamiensis TaxID=60552 RepID=UPI00312CAEEA
MGSTAVSAQGSKIEIQGSGVSTPKNISGLALGFPTIISSSAHGFQNGDIVTFAGLLGNTTLNGVTATVKNVTAGTYAVDVDTTGGAPPIPAAARRRRIPGSRSRTQRRSRASMASRRRST